MQSDPTWYSVKCVFRHPNLAKALSYPLDEGAVLYEERIVIFRAGSFEEAITLGEEEAKAYAEGDGDIQYTGFISAYQMSVQEMESGAEIYSLMRSSTLDVNAFLDRYHDDGSERTQHF